jgi:hypothetical protein
LDGSRQSTHRFEEAVGTSNIRFQRLEWLTLCVPNLSLCPEVEDDVDLVVHEGSLDSSLVLEGTVDTNHPPIVSTAHELGPRVLVTDERNQRHACVEEAAHERAADYAARAGHEGCSAS